MEYIDFAKKFMHQSGIIFKKYFYGNKNIQYKIDTTPVTKADLEINDLLISMIQDNYPSHAVMGEEASDLKEAEFIWICDPVDGTIPYSRNMPFSTICLSLLKNGISIFGAVYDPLGDKLYLSDGKTTTCNDSILRISAETDITKGIVAIECYPRARYDFRKLHNVLCDLDYKVIQLCSIAFPSVLVATGDIIATIHPGSQIWEIPAVKPIVESAGGKVTDLFGNEQNYLGEIHGHLTTNGVMHDFFVDLIKQHVDLS